jgi:hypothetical protein
MKGVHAGLVTVQRALKTHRNFLTVRVFYVFPANFTILGSLLSAFATVSARYPCCAAAPHSFPGGCSSVSACKQAGVFFVFSFFVTWLRLV